MNILSPCLACECVTIESTLTAVSRMPIGARASRRLFITNNIHEKAHMRYSKVLSTIKVYSHIEICVVHVFVVYIHKIH